MSGSGSSLACSLIKANFTRLINHLFPLPKRVKRDPVLKLSQLISLLFRNFLDEVHLCLDKSPRFSNLSHPLISPNFNIHASKIYLSPTKEKKERKKGEGEGRKTKRRNTREESRKYQATIFLGRGKIKGREIGVK